MNSDDRQFNLNRLLFCQAFFKWHNKDFYVRHPTLKEIFRGDVIYRESIQTCVDCPSYDDLLILTSQLGFWTLEQQRELDGFYQNLDKLRLEIYENRFKSETKETIRKAIRLTETNINRLENIRNKFRYVSRESIALQAKLRYIVGACICDEDGNSYLSRNFWNRSIKSIVNHALHQVTLNRLGEKEIRDLAKHEPWSSMWNAAEISNGIFPNQSSELSDEQKALVMWSRVYENARSAEGMTDDTIEDDDVFDGWMLNQNKDRQRAQDAVWLESKLSAKVKGHEHVFVMAETDTDIKRLHELNDAHGKFVKKQLFEDISKQETTLDQHTRFGQDKMRNALAKANHGYATRINSGK